MKNRFFCTLQTQRQAIDRRTLPLALAGLSCALLWSLPARAGEAPQWMHAVANASLPAHDEKTNAVLLYSETSVNVISADKIKTVQRRAYKILRPEGRDYGTALVSFRSPGEKVNNMKGWCIPAQGKDYEVKDKEAIEASLPKVEGSELISDVRVKILVIPAADPGNIVGYEYELEENPLVLQNNWIFQKEEPVKEARYSLQLPPGWEYQAAFLNYPDLKPVQANGQWHWTITDVKGLREEEDMPPSNGVQAQLIVNLLPPGGPGLKGFSNWRQMGSWYASLTSGRRDASEEIKQKVSQLTATSGNNTTATYGAVTGSLVNLGQAATPGEPARFGQTAYTVDAASHSATVTYDAVLTTPAGVALARQRFTASAPVSGKIESTTVGTPLNAAANKVATEVAAWVAAVKE